MDIDTLVTVLRFAALVAVIVVLIVGAYFAMLFSAAHWLLNAPIEAKKPWYVRFAMLILKGSGH